MQGEWVDRTALRKAREKCRDPSEADYTFQETLELTPIPCLEHLSREDYLAWVCEVIEDIELEAKRMHEENGTRPLGADAVCAKSPFDEPAPAKRTPAPLFMTASREAFRELMEAYRRVVAAFMEASVRFRAGDEGVEFPIGTFPPAPKPRLYPPPRAPGP